MICLTGFVDQMKKWKAWELETSSLEYQFSNGNSYFLLVNSFKNTYKFIFKPYIIDKLHVKRSCAVFIMNIKNFIF